MARILVTGGGGFIGSHLVDYLIAAGSEVTVLDDFSSGSLENLADGMRSGRLRIVEGSVLSMSDIRAAADNCDTVFHLAVKSVRHSLGQPIENHAVNAGGTLNVLEVARRAQIRRFVYCSSSEVYGNSPATIMCEESTICNPVTVYGGSKLAGEHYTSAYCEAYGLPTVIVRPFNTYGPRAHVQGESGEVIPRFFAQLLNGQQPAIFGDGVQTRDFIFVKDTVRGIAQAGAVENAIGKVINIAAGEEISVLELALTISAICQRPDLKPAFHPARPGDLRALRADVRLSQKILQFQPAVKLDEGLRLYFAWLAGAILKNPLMLTDIPLKNWTMM